MVVLADAETVRRRAADRYIGSTVRQQLAQADLILLNKCDLAADPDAVEAWLGVTAPTERIVRATQADAPIDVVLGIQTDRGRLASGGSLSGHTGDYTVAALDPPGDADPELAARTLADPAHRLLRAKGFIRRPDGSMAAIQVVGNRWAVSDAAAEAPAGLVCIGLKGQVDLAAIQRALARR